MTSKDGSALKFTDGSLLSHTNIYIDILNLQCSFLGSYRYLYFVAALWLLWRQELKTDFYRSRRHKTKIKSANFRFFSLVKLSRR